MGDSEGAQEAAHRLLTELRMVARRLPGTLHPATSAESLLTQLRQQMRVDRGLVLVHTGGQRLAPLAYLGGHPLDWDLQLSADSAVAEAWASQHAQVREGQNLRSSGELPAGSCLSIPLMLGRRTFGVVAVECAETGAYATDVVSTAVEATAAVSLPLSTGLLFDELRTLVTLEERQRLAREVHDGIAQEMVYLGYALDDILSECDSETARAATIGVRAEITRIIDELRMSLYNLRSAVDPQAGLAASLSDHIRAVGTAAGLAVHLSLSESPLRLPADVEAELLRIAQEAMANARKHSRAKNLWVTCELNPPAAKLVVEDDGIGFVQPSKKDCFGLQIMQERAERVGGILRIEPRSLGGTRVSISLGTLRTEDKFRLSQSTPL